MMSRSVPSCGICEYQHIFEPAFIWCSQCKEGLCLDCKKHHGISKATRKHDTIPISEYLNLPSYFTKNNQNCTRHEQQYQIYCNEHEYICCSKCIVEEHSNCQNIVNLEDVVKNTKTSNAFLKINETLHEVAETIQQIRQEKSSNQKALSEKRKQIECEIQQVRLDINKYLDNLQENMLSELNEIGKRENEKISHFMKTLNDHEIKVAEYEKTFTHIKQYSSDLQAFLALKQLEGGVNEECQFIDSLTENDVLNRVEIKCNINTALLNIIKSFVVFGKVYIENCNASVNIVKKKQQQAQVILHKTLSLPFEKIQVQLKQKQQSWYPISGCCILPDDRFVLTISSSKTVSVYKGDGHIDFDLPLNCYYHRHVAYNSDDNTIAISSRYTDKITIINLTERQVKKIFSIGGKINCIAMTNKTLIYHKENYPIQVMDVNEESTRYINAENICQVNGITIFDHKLYYSSYDHHKIECCDLQGTQLWTFKNEHVLSHPLGISSDNDGNVYVAGCGTNNVVVISPDGQKHKELLNEWDGLHSPSSINFGRATNQLLVAADSKAKKLFLYNVFRN